MSDPENGQCPLCGVSRKKFKSNYHGSFLSCKDLLQCQSCELIYSDKLPSKSELNEYYSSGLYYDKVSDPFEPEILKFSFKLSQSRLKLIFSHLNFSSAPKIIDIGAGNAQLGLALQQSNEAFTYDAVEPDEEVSNKYGYHVKQKFTDINQIKVGAYDLGVMNQVLEHIPDPVDFLDSVCRLLKPDGYMYIDVPFEDYLFKPSLEPHILFWNKKSMSVLLKKARLQMIFCDSAGMPHSLAKRFFSRQSFNQKIRNPWIYLEKINLLMSKLGLPKPFDTFRQFHSDLYGGKRQWLRCIAQKMNQK